MNAMDKAFAQYDEAWDKSDARFDMADGFVTCSQCQSNIAKTHVDCPRAPCPVCRKREAFVTGWDDILAGREAIKAARKAREAQCTSSSSSC